VSVRAHEDHGGRESEYDLLTAALIGATIGAGLTYMLRRGMSGDRPVAPVMRGIRTGAKWAGRHANHLSRRGGKWAQRQGRDLWDRVPRDEIADHVSDYAENMSDYVGRARHAIDDAVQSELKDLRRSIRRQRKRLGI
jgi:hypothetical protein